MRDDLNMEQSLANISEKLLSKLQKLLLILCVHYLKYPISFEKGCFLSKCPYSYLLKVKDIQFGSFTYWQKELLISIAAAERSSILSG